MKGTILLALGIRTILLAQMQHKLACGHMFARENVKFWVFIWAKHLKQALWIILNNIPFWHDLRIYTGFSMWVLKAPNYVLPSLFPGLLWWLSGKESACQCRRCGFDPWVGKIPWSRKWQSTQFSCLGNPMNRGAWQATIHGVSKRQTWLSFWRGPLFPSVLYKIVFFQFFITQKFRHSWGEKY